MLSEYLIRWYQFAAVLIFVTALFVLFSERAFSGTALPSADDAYPSTDTDLSPGSRNEIVLEPRIFLPLLLTWVDDGIIPFGPVHGGEGTYYDATGAGNCLFPPSPNDLMVAALNHTDYDNAALCGSFISVQGPDGTVMVRIVDRCPECPAGDVDLSREAFALIADLPLGRVPISWRQVSPPLDGPIIYHFKDGSNQWWTAVQIRNHRNPILRVEYQSDKGIFKEVPRTDYNYFVESSGMGPGPFTFRVTDVFGNTIVDSGVPHIENGNIVGSAQFPPPP